MEQQTISQLLDLTNKTAIVTGGAMGIGLGIVRRLHEAGANVVVADLDAATAENVATELNTKRANSAMSFELDVSKAADVKNLIAAAVQQFNTLDIMVNNAGIFPFVPLANMDEAAFMKVIDVNLRGVYLGTKFASEQMITQGNGGNIITTASIDSLHPSSVGLAAYDASKHGVYGFIKNVAIELAPHNIRVNAIAPGGVSTPGAAKAMPADVDPKIMEASLARIPMHRMGDPDEMGRVVLFLASELSSYMTGSLVVADGGMLLS
jgi:2-deoxy-D-gluconate 3-dehydrogenase